MVIDLVSSSIIMLPYCKSLWQNPIWSLVARFFSKANISSSRTSKRNSVASWGKETRLASLTHFLKHHIESQLALGVSMKYYTLDIEKTVGDKRTYSSLSQRTIFLDPGISRQWNSFILEAIIPDISGSRKSAAESVWKSSNQTQNVQIFILKNKMSLGEINHLNWTSKAIIHLLSQFV